jgi:glutamate carboxypeptidase
LLQAQTPDMLALLEQIVRLESPSRDKSALDALSAELGRAFASAGATVTRLPQTGAGDHLRLDWPGVGADPARPILILGHFDTVWPIGTLAEMPFHIEGDRAHGPGSFDMKASLVILAFAMRALQSLQEPPPRPVVALLTSDEEIGSPTSRTIIEQAAAESACALVIEPALPGGGLKTARKGVGAYTLTIHGRAAHAGVEPETGRSAILELCHQIIHINAINDIERGTSVNVGIVEGGSTVNTVPDMARAKIDLRVAALDEAERVDAALRSLQPITPDTSLAVSGGLNRPPMVRTSAVKALFQRARDLARPLGLELTEGATGGGSDANFTAAVGLPTLDGLGALGDGAHARHEHILIPSLAQRAALLAKLITSLQP